MGYIGFQLGLSVELTKLIGLIGGIFISFRYYQAWGDFVSQRTFLSVEWAAALSMVILVMAGYLLMTRAIQLAERLVKLTFQNTFANAAGLIAGILRATLAISVVLVALKQVPSPYLEASVEERSLTGPYLVLIAPRLYDAGLDAAKNLLRRMEA